MNTTAAILIVSAALLCGLLLFLFRRSIGPLHPGRPHRLYAVLFWVAVLSAFLTGISLLCFKRPHFVPFPEPNHSLYHVLHDYVQRASLRPSDWTLTMLGTTGTPVVVGYEIDRSRTGIFRGVIPTNFSVRVRHSLYYAIKNVGKTNAQLGCETRVGGNFGGPLYPPFYGFSGQMGISPTGSGGGGGGILTPTDWPETLPPRMTKREARKHDFKKELYETWAREYEALAAQNPQHFFGLAGIYEHFLKNYAAAAAAYEKFFAVDYKDAVVLNGAAYGYVQDGGTNLGRAYEVALKAQALDPHSGYIADTVAWILFKQGKYDEALESFRLGVNPVMLAREAVISFHLGMAYYMLMQEDAARTAFQNVVRGGQASPELEQAKKCLEILDINERAPTSKLIAKLKTRLTEVPDDPVALSRLAGLFEQDGGVRRDSLVSKALGLQAYRRGEYARAAQYLTESGKERPSDADLFFYLGMAWNRLNRHTECVDSLRKTLALNPKVAQAEEANRVLASLERMPGK